jgi:hypothetical protein
MVQATRIAPRTRGSFHADPNHTAPPTITVTTNLNVGSTLVANLGGWAGSNAPITSRSRQWLRSGTAIAGQTGVSYVLDVADIGWNISLRETAISDFGVGEALSAEVGPVLA